MNELRTEEVVEEVSALSEDHKDHLRTTAKADLYFMSKGVLGYQDVNLDTHGAFCLFIQAQERKRRLGLMPRTHLKSTIATIADNVRLGVSDPDEYRSLIGGETATKAQAFLSEIKGHFEKNVLLRALFPDVIPTRFNGPGVTWSKDVACLVRNTSYKEPTWTAIGVGGALVGAHYTRIKCDDLIGFEASRSPAKMAEAIAWSDNIEPLLVDQHVDIIDFIGTRWSRKDLYAHIMEVYGPRIAVFAREAIENGEIIFPALHTWEEYQQLMTKTPAVWFAQYCNNPKSSDKSDFPAEMVKAYAFNMDATEVTFRDEVGREKRWPIAQLDRVMCADPNSGSVLAPDMAAVAVVGVSPDNEVFVLAMWSGRVSPSAFVDKIYSMAKRWRPRVLGIEKAGQQSTQHYFEIKAEEEDFRIRVEPLLHKSQEKEYRIRTALEPIIRSGQLYLLPSQQVLREQIVSFPDNILIDELDALAYFVQLARRPMRQEDQEERGKVINLMLAKRNRRTGY